jgi:hypothetical protein
MIRLWILLILLVLLAFGVSYLVRGAVRRSREELKHVDRGKLHDLSRDQWERDDDPNDR